MSNKTIYPSKFKDAKMNVPATPNVEFSFVVKAPKEYVMDAWHLPKSEGGAILPITQGNSKKMLGLELPMTWSASLILAEPMSRR